MIEIIALNFITKQMILLGVGISVGILLLLFGGILFMKVKSLKNEHSVESLPTLVDLGMEGEAESFENSSPEEETSAFFDSDEDEDEIMQGKFLG